MLVMSNKMKSRTLHKVVFTIGCVAGLVALASTVCSWTAPFPLVSDGRGGFSLNPHEDRVLIAGLWSAVAASVLGGFGRGKSRVAVILSGPLLIVCSLLGWLGNHR